MGHAECQLLHCKGRAVGDTDMGVLRNSTRVVSKSIVSKMTFI